jgi:hypothetical protein
MRPCWGRGKHGSGGYGMVCKSRYNGFIPIGREVHFHEQGISIKVRNRTFTVVGAEAAGMG